ncbi:MAG TPA: PIG-L family deacetylase [Salinimicrobium sp.]|nr:PIG-L family deacetylase [Salinimicrobium sp.]
MQKSYFLLLILFFPFFLSAQKPEPLSSSEIYQKLEKLNFLGSVLYIAAHPDDENTKIISYFANEKNARTAYLSLTRGDGGQNLIGPEIRESLGVIRTQELLAARNIDGGEQLFSRANDFGYSKNPEETFNIWDQEEVLKDVVWAIRKFRPDIIINRFDHRTPGKTHGHHTASAILSVNAFDLASKESVFPQQLEIVEPWQPKRLFYNTSWWFYGSHEAFEKVDKSNFLKIESGVYYPLFGQSNTEISALSRSQHQSQGFGSTEVRGSEIEYLELLKGKLPENKSNLFEGIDTSWKRVQGGATIGDILTDVQQNFDFKNPSASLPQLVKAYSLIQKLENDHWRKIKSTEIKEIIAACAGLYLEAIADQKTATKGETITISLEAINRSPAQISLSGIKTSSGKDFLDSEKPLKNNQKWEESFQFKIEEDTPYTTPYWLEKKGSVGMYSVDNQLLRGLPETPNHHQVIFNIEIEGSSIPFEREIVYRENDIIHGAVYAPFKIIPDVSVAALEAVYIFPDSTTQDVTIKVKSFKENFSGKLSIAHPENWQIEPKEVKISLKEKGEEKLIRFKITPPKNAESIVMTAKIESNGETFSQKIDQINYEHIKPQIILFPSEFKTVKLKIDKKGKRVAYIEGAGDVVPQSLEQIGYEVAILKPEEISSQSLKNFDAVVMGIRAYNISETLNFKQDILFEFVKNGGNLIVQYNTNRGVKVENIAPFPLKLSKDRVTDEEAKIIFLTPEHPVLNTPNKITKADFENWVQERGLYFPDEWSKEFNAILSAHDLGENQKNGSLLVAKYGKGYYIYTGLSFFRQFPEGVPGAYRLFANLISIGKE